MAQKVQSEHVYEGEWMKHSRSCWCWELEDMYTGPCFPGE